MTSTYSSTQSKSNPLFLGTLTLMSLLSATAQADTHNIHTIATDEYSTNPIRIERNYEPSTTTGGYSDHLEAKEFAQAFLSFYSALEAQQERLDPEMSKILYDNLWDLYDD